MPVMQDSLDLLRGVRALVVDGRKSQVSGRSRAETGRGGPGPAILIARAVGQIHFVAGKWRRCRKEGFCLRVPAYVRKGEKLRR